MKRSTAVIVLPFLIASILVSVMVVICSPRSRLDGPGAVGATSPNDSN